MKGKRVFHKIIRVTDGVIGTITDLVLLQMYFVLCTPGKHTQYDMQRALNEAEQILESVNYQTIKRAIYHLTESDLIKRSPSRTSLDLEITDLGRKRIEETFPICRTKRPWDGHVYLISYDIPTKANKVRNLLRHHMIRMGCALLQDSLWITPYAPHVIIEEFKREHHPGGTILVSKLGSDGAIGEESLHDLISRVYRLPDLGKRYEKFLAAYPTKTKPPSQTKFVLDYLKILKDDPQLPFPLLPKDFPAARAYERFVAITSH